MPRKQFKVRQISTGKVFRCAMENDTTFFVFAPKKRKYGYRYEQQDFVQKFEILKPHTTETERWHRRIQKVIQKLNTTGLWQDLIPNFENLLNITLEDYNAICNLERNNPSRVVQRYYRQYPFLFICDANGNPSLNREYMAEIYQCKLKSMYFGKSWNADIKDEFRRAIQHGLDYRTPRIRTTYDVQLEYNAKKQKAWYSEEYRRYHNGHYYIVLDENTALFCEDD